MIFGLNLVGLCLGFSFPLASSASLAWILGLGFPAILQTRYDLGCGISLLNFSTFEAVLASFLNHLLPYSPLLPIREALDLLPELMVFPASGILRKHPSSPATSPVLQGLRWGGGEGSTSFEMDCRSPCWTFLREGPVPSAPPQRAPVLQLGSVISCSVLVCREMATWRISRKVFL